MLIKLSALTPEEAEWNQMTSYGFENRKNRVTVIYEVEKINGVAREQLCEISELLKKITRLQEEAGEEPIGFKIQIQEIST